jgi:hypothetical protein
MNVQQSIVATSYYGISGVAMAFQNYASNPDEYTRMAMMTMCYKRNDYNACSYINSYNLSLLEMMISLRQ